MIFLSCIKIQHYQSCHLNEAINATNVTYQCCKGLNCSGILVLALVSHNLQAQDVKDSIYCRTITDLTQIYLEEFKFSIEDSVSKPKILGHNRVLFYDNFLSERIVDSKVEIEDLILPFYRISLNDCGIKVFTELMHEQIWVIYDLRHFLIRGTYLSYVSISCKRTLRAFSDVNSNELDALTGFGSLECQIIGDWANNVFLFFFVNIQIFYILSKPAWLAGKKGDVVSILVVLITNFCFYLFRFSMLV